MSDEKIFEKLVETVPPPVRPWAVGIVLAYCVAVIAREILPLIPKTRSAKRRKVAVSLLNESGSSGSADTENPEAGVSIEPEMRDHIQSLKATDAFYELTGIRCKEESRRLWIGLYRKSGDEWTWGKLSSVAAYFKPQAGELRYRARTKDHLLNTVFEMMLFAAVAIGVLVLSKFGRLTDAKDVVAVSAIACILTIVGWTCISGFLPWVRAQRLRRECVIAYFDRKAASGEAGHA